MRTHPEPAGYYPRPARPVVPQPQPAPGVLFVVPEADRMRYASITPGATFAHNTIAATQAVAAQASRAPLLVVIDLDTPGVDVLEICRAAAAARHTMVLVTTETVEKVPAAIKAGCSGVLLKPFQANLLAARVGRMQREMPQPGRRTPSTLQGSTNRVWDEVACPSCGHTGATAFDFASHRRSWYACLTCERTWLGRRHE